MDPVILDFVLLVVLMIIYYTAAVAFVYGVAMITWIILEILNMEYQEGRSARKT